MRRDSTHKSLYLDAIRRPLLTCLPTVIVLPVLPLFALSISVVVDGGPRRVDLIITSAAGLDHLISSRDITADLVMGSRLPGSIWPVRSISPRPTPN